MNLRNPFFCLLLLAQSYSGAAGSNTLPHRVWHWGACTPEEVSAGYETGTKWYNGGLAGPTPRTVCFYPREGLSKIFLTNANSFVQSCLAAKRAFDIPATEAETDQWSTWSQTNGHDENSLSALCYRRYSNARYVSLRMLRDNEFRACGIYDTQTQRYNFEFVDHSIQNSKAQFESCLKSVYRKLERVI